MMFCVIRKHFEVEPWNLLARKSLNWHEDLDVISTSEGRTHHYM
jgi:hypothetical protein